MACLGWHVNDVTCQSNVAVTGLLSCLPYSQLQESYSCVEKEGLGAVKRHLSIKW